MRIDKFKGEYRFLSNFYLLKNPILYQGISYPTSEHFYQAFKTLDFSMRSGIASLTKPGEVKKQGRRLPLRKDWIEIKVDVMFMACLLKFSNNVDIYLKLIETNNKELIEGNNWHDNFWGNCECNRCVNIIGENHLGKTLMELRDVFEDLG